MASKKAKEIITNIEVEFRKLAKITGTTHISAYLINGSFCIEDYTDLKKPKFSYNNRGAENKPKY